ncbi:SDR family oxidoreductase [Mucilaginibacter sp.]|uniref:SDR family oxidoreductase n=1 Tax=Mucilaginibacter sp. TaxID=1882438 RepID=UPI0028518E70|nr:SDR family oxidoreductase [Mucilaginibacter sp.]MDR3695115.1 SDR family oxidoreductase [Mucilaginibacter sp.]
MVVSILGCGWYGKALAADLLKKGTIVKGSATSPEKLEVLDSLRILPYLAIFDSKEKTVDPGFFKCDVMVISVPPRLKAGEDGEYLAKIQQAINACMQYGVKKIIYISSTGVYGEVNHEVSELDDPKPDTASGLILFEAEQHFQKETSFKTTVIRFGGLIGPGRHPGRFFAGKSNIPNGLAPVNLIHQDDCVGITTAIIDQDTFGYLFNGCSPDHPAKAAYYREMAEKANLPAPQFINELKNRKIVNSNNVPGILKYEFKFKKLKDYTFDAIT